MTDVPNPDPTTYEVGDRVKFAENCYTKYNKLHGTVTRVFICESHRRTHGQWQIEVDWDDGTHTIGIFTKDFEKLPKDLYSID